MAKRGTLDYFCNLYNEEIGRTFAGKAIRAKNVWSTAIYSCNQEDGCCIWYNPGTGKTFVAVVMAVQALKKGEVEENYFDSSSR